MRVSDIVSVFVKTDMRKPKEVRRLFDEMLCWMLQAERDIDSLREEISRLKSGSWVEH